MKKGLSMAIAGILVGIMGIWMLTGYLPVRGIETPKYELVAKHNGYEIRQYAPYIVAEVTEKGGYRETQNRGFRDIAGYIFGGNKAKASISMTAPVLHEPEDKSEKIAMTAPVIHEKGGEPDVYKLAFVMPSSYTLDTLPAPNNPNVVLRQVPAKKYAAVRFRGYAPEKTVARKAQWILDHLKVDGIQAKGVPFVAQYHPPWTPPFMRHNEVLVEIN